MLGDEVAFAGVVGQADLVRRGEVTARELVELALARIERLNPELNAFGAVYPERALREAAAVDARVAAGEAAPLLGVPIGVKDEMDIAGEVTSFGTGAMVTRAVTDCDAVRRAREAGAIVVGKTTMPELGLWPFTESITWGVTRNPWDLERTPGGSSGGSASAVAAGLVPTALSADGAGSIRIPAACCGLFGLKPQRDRVSLAPHARRHGDWLVFGALTRSVPDSGLMLDVLSEGEHGFEGAARTEPGPLRVALVDSFPLGTHGRLSGEVRGALERTAALLRSRGHTVVDAKLDMRLSDVPVVLGMMFRLIRDLLEEVERPWRLERRTRTFARPSALVPDRVVDRLLARQAAGAARVAAIFDEHDVLLTPVMSEPAMPAGAMDGRGAIATYMWESSWVPFNILWNIAGHPAASVPAGWSATGLPLAVQLVGRAGAEHTLLSLSAQLEAERPWADRRPAMAVDAAGSSG